MSAVKQVDYSRICWYCGNATMRPADDYFKCSNCGTTWNPVLKLGAVCVTEDAGSKSTPRSHSSVPIYERRNRREKD